MGRNSPVGDTVVYWLAAGTPLPRLREEIRPREWGQAERFIHLRRKAEYLRIKMALCIKKIDIILF